MNGQQYSDYLAVLEREHSARVIVFSFSHKQEDRAGLDAAYASGKALDTAGLLCKACPFAGLRTSVHTIEMPVLVTDYVRPLALIQGALQNHAVDGLLRVAVREPQSGAWIVVWPENGGSFVFDELREEVRRRENLLTAQAGQLLIRVLDVCRRSRTGQSTPQDTLTALAREEEVQECLAEQFDALPTER